MPHLAHTIHLCMLDYIQNWIFHVINMHEQFNKYNAIKLSVPSYCDRTQKISHMRMFLNGMGRR
jgi:hypothetical protein